MITGLKWLEIPSNKTFKHISFQESPFSFRTEEFIRLKILTLTT